MPYRLPGRFADSVTYEVPRGVTPQTDHERVTRWCGLWQCGTTTDLVVSEPVTDLIRHAAGAIRMCVIRHRTLTVEVSDDADTGSLCSTRQDHPGRAGTDARRTGDRRPTRCRPAVPRR